MPTLTEVQKAYLAGYLDADGYVGMVFLKSKAHFGEIRIEINIASTCKKTIEEIRDIVGYGVIDEKRSKSLRKPCYVWRINSQKEILDFLINILPYSRTKRRQLELLKEYIESRRSRSRVIQEIWKNGRLYRIPHKPPYTEREKEIVLEVQKLNRGGG